MKKTTFRLSKLGLLSLAIGAAAASQAQDAAEAPQAAGPALEEVVVTGYRGSLLSSTNAKRESNGFSDVIFADDIGNLPSQNLAESLNRIPGVKISREVTGEGQQISVRGLGPSFTKIALNGNSMAVASTGNMTSGNRNREVDLDLFPTELFSSLAVSKTATASQLEGGVSGYVNMRTARPSDFDGEHVSYSIEGAYSELSEEVSPRYSFMYSNSNDRFGVLFGLAGEQKQFRVDGYEAVALYTDGCVAEWSNPEQTNSACIEGSEGFNHFFWSPEATPDYAAANPGVAVGDPVDPVATSGLDADTLDTALLPYLGRPMTTVGDRDRVTGLLSFEFRPNDDMEFVLDTLYAEAKRDFTRTEAMLWGRRNYLHQGAAIIPENVSVDENGYVSNATFYNAHLWVGSHQYDEDLDFVSVMPSLSWQITDSFKADLSASYTRSTFERDEPYVLYMSPGGTMQYSMTGTLPSFNFSVDPASPDIGWTWQQEYDQNGDGTIQGNEKFGDRFRIQRNERTTETTGFHADFALGEDADINGLKFGIAWDENSSDMDAFGGTAEFEENFVNGSDADANFADYLGPSLVNNLGSNISGYRGYTGIAQVDWARIKEATGYDDFEPIQATGDQFGQTVGNISEEMLGLYIEGNIEQQVADRPLRINAGVRWVDTQQNVSTVSSETEADYSKILPSFSMVYDLRDDIKLRMSGSRSLTRANPADMFPNSTWGGSGIDTVRAGNPFLTPFEATNFDIGGEWYFDTTGYVGFTHFIKEVTGFTRSDTLTVDFVDLPQYGMDINNIGDDREQALAECGGPSQCSVQVSTRSNVDGSTTLSGYEAMWVMPLDFIVEGLGFDTSATHISQDASDEDAIVTGISDWTYNFTAFYETDRLQARLTYYHQDGAVAGYTNGFEIISMDRSQVDFSGSYRLPFMESQNLTVTFDAYNITDEPVGSWHEVEGVTFDAFYPGATYTLGIRGSF
ncbi:TonB-dependent receptor [Marinimicrobium sp. ARAG 43.8]|uniref:TonB-dependent receptor n=1 Tax=Marinimicrobium sp. ARAG 43.8 TaxID=3418719 RepID=UPI003CF76270